MLSHFISIIVQYIIDIGDVVSTIMHTVPIVNLHFIAETTVNHQRKRLLRVN